MKQKIKNVITDKLYMAADADKASENGIQFQIVKRGKTFFLEEPRVQMSMGRERIRHHWSRPFFGKGNAFKTYEEAFEALKELVQFQKDDHTDGEVVMQWMGDWKIKEQEDALLPKTTVGT